MPAVQAIQWPGGVGFGEGQSPALIQPPTLIPAPMGLRSPPGNHPASHSRAAPNTPDESPCFACTIGVRATSPKTCFAISTGTSA